MSKVIKSKVQSLKLRPLSTFYFLLSTRNPLGISL